MVKWSISSNRGYPATSLVLAAGLVLVALGQASRAEPTRQLPAIDVAAAMDRAADATVDLVVYRQASDRVAAGADLGDPPPALAEEVQPVDEGGDPSAPRRFRPITEVTADARLPEGLLPEQDARDSRDAQWSPIPAIVDARLAGGWSGSVFQWSATQLCHGPLYFEEVNLERYGYQCHPAVQPFVSGAHFFLAAPTLPYQMTVHPPRECIYTLGHYRPGSRVPWQRHRLPWDARAAAVQAGVAVGLIFLIP